MQESEKEKTNVIAAMLSAWATLPDILSLLRSQAARLDNIEAIISKGQKQADADCWLDAKAAAEYMRMCATSFDKYRYKTTPRIEGYPLDGKILYKKADLDNFVKLYALKAKGVA